MGRYYLKESEIADTAQPNMTTICSTGDSAPDTDTGVFVWASQALTQHPPNDL
jgi:hypothetical protein